MQLLERYRAGESHAVWDELLAHGAAVREPRLLHEAEEVVRETMLRVRENIAALVAGLEKQGFEFGYYPDGEDVPAYRGPLVPPASNVGRTIAKLEKVVGGPVPLALAGFWRYVGDVCLVGMHPDWPASLCSDPLWVDRPSFALSEAREWFSEGEPEDDDGFAAPIAPDALHKDNVSGGAPYEIALPDAAADAVLLNEGNDYFFVDYLRQALRWGGFPGFAASPDLMPAWLVRLSEHSNKQI